MTKRMRNGILRKTMAMIMIMRVMLVMMRVMMMRMRRAYLEARIWRSRLLSSI
jgi:hypothetical protein